MLFDQEDNEPNYSPGAGGYGPGLDQGYGGPRNIGKYIKIGVMLLILIIIAVGVLMWWGSQRTITISLVDYSGADVSGNITLLDSSNKTVATNPRGSASTFTATLWPGEYKVNASSSGYKSISYPFTVPSDSDVVEVRMPRDISATMQIDLPKATIYSSQNIIGQITINNKGKPFDAAYIVMSKSDSLIATPITDGITINPGTNQIDFNLSVNPNVKKAADTNLGFEIKGTITKATYAMPIHISMSVSATNIDVSGIPSTVSLKAGEDNPLKITITNKDRDNSVENLDINIVPDDTSQEKLGWISFAQEGGTETTVSQLDPQASTTLNLIVHPPITATKSDSFKGTLEISSYSITKTKTLPITMNIGTEKTANVAFSNGTSPVTLSVQCTSDNCPPKDFPTEIKIQNMGNLDVGEVDVNINYSMSKAEDQPLCFNWISINPKSFPALKAGEIESIETEIRPQFDLIPDTKVVNCYLAFKYLSPITQQIESDNKQVIININS